MDFALSKLIIEIVCTPILTIAALLALKQIDLNKRIATKNAKREALKLSGEQCSHYLTQIIPLQDKLDKASKIFRKH